jgi:probable phosphoglycerate mutase
VGDSRDSQVFPLTIFGILHAFERTEALKAAVTLDVFTAVSDQGSSADEIAARCKTSPRGMSVVFASPLGRALQTAEIIWRIARIAAPIIIDPDLMEIGMGSAEGITETEMHERWPTSKAASAHEPMTLQSPDGESLEALAKRLRRALHRVARHNAVSRIIVSHGVSGRMLRALHLGLSSVDVHSLDAPQDALFCLKDIGVTRYSFSQTKSPLETHAS